MNEVPFNVCLVMDLWNTKGREKQTCVTSLRERGEGRTSNTETVFFYFLLLEE